MTKQSNSHRVITLMLALTLFGSLVLTSAPARASNLSPAERTLALCIFIAARATPSYLSNDNPAPASAVLDECSREAYTFCFDKRETGAMCGFDLLIFTTSVLNAMEP